MDILDCFPGKKERTISHKEKEDYGMDEGQYFIGTQE